MEIVDVRDYVTESKPHRAKSRRANLTAATSKSCISVTLSEYAVTTVIESITKAQRVHSKSSK